MSAQVEVDLAIDVDSRNYDQDSESRLRMTKQVYYYACVFFVNLFQRNIYLLKFSILSCAEH